VFILPLHLDYTKVIILILWWRNFQLEYWRTFQLVSTDWAIVYFTLFVQIAFIDANIKKRKRTKKKIESFSFYSVRFCSIYIDLSVNKRMMCLFESNVLISATNLR
ncbi:hypothetical protein DW046_12740, partial [Bacteroides stercoris]